MSFSKIKRIAIHSVPRSGSTWLGSIFDSSPEVVFRFQPLFSYGHKGQITSNSSKEEIDNFFVDILNTNDEFVLQKEAKEKGIIPTFEKEKISTIVYKEVRYHHILKNLLENDKDIFVIGIVRNPLSVINSWLKAPKEFRKDLGWKELDEWRYAKKKNQNRVEEFNGYEKWKEVAKLFIQLKEQYPKRFYLLKYQQLLKNTEYEVKKIFNFCNLRYTKQTEHFINTSSKFDKSSDAYSVFRSKQTDDKWKKELNPLIVQEIKHDLKGMLLEEYLK